MRIGEGGGARPGGVAQASNADREVLIEQARAGDREALGSLLNEARDPLLRAAGRELPLDLRAKEDLSDLVQETFLVAHRRIDRFNGRTHGEFVSWLKGILRNTSLRLRRSFRTERRGVYREVRFDGVSFREDELGGGEASPSALAARHEDEANLKAAVRRLSNRDRCVLQWRHRDELTFEQMGRRLGISTVAARNAWLQALKRLRDELDCPPQTNHV